MHPTGEIVLAHAHNGLWERALSLLGASASVNLPTSSEGVSVASYDPRVQLGLLRRLGRRARLDAISYALAAASDAEAEVFAAELVELAARDVSGLGLRELAKRWCRLPESARLPALILGAGGASAGAHPRCTGETWGDIVPGLLADADPRVRCSAARLAGEAGDPMLAAPLVSLLSDQNPHVRDAAERALTALTTMAEDRERQGMAPWRAAVHRALGAAVEAYPEHRRKGVLAAAARVLGTPAGWRGADPSLREWLADESHPAQMSMRSVIRRGQGPGMRTVAWQWLTLRAVSSACLERLAARTADVAEHEAVLSRIHLLGHPRRLAALERLGRSSRRVRIGDAAPSAAMVPQLSGASRAALPAWLAALSNSAAAAARPEGPGLLVADASAAVRHAVVRAGRGAALAPAYETDLCFDGDERVARGAALTVARGALAGTRRGVAGPEDMEYRRTLGHLRRSAHPYVRGLARRLMEHLDPWEASSGASRVAARRWHAADPDGFIARLRERIGGGTAEETVRAIMLARRMRLAGRVELELLTVVSRAASEAPSVATAVMALAEVATAASSAAVGACVRHVDDRVRANAVEALVRRARHGCGEVGAEGLEAVLMELRADSGHRARANAVRGLLLGAGAQHAPDAGAGATALAAILEDPRAGHRLAGVWLSERLVTEDLGARWDDLVGRIAELVRSDADAAVRRRAQRCARLLLARMRSGWSVRSGVLTGSPVEALV